METDATRMCALLVGLPDVRVVGVGEWLQWLRIVIVTDGGWPPCCGGSVHRHGVISVRPVRNTGMSVTALALSEPDLTARPSTRRITSRTLRIVPAPSPAFWSFVDEAEHARVVDRPDRSCPEARDEVPADDRLVALTTLWLAVPERLQPRVRPDPEQLVAAAGVDPVAVQQVGLHRAGEALGVELAGEAALALPAAVVSVAKLPSGPRRTSWSASGRQPSPRRVIGLAGARRWPASRADRRGSCRGPVLEGRPASPPSWYMGGTST